MEPITATWLGVSGLALTIIIMILRWWFKRNDSKDKIKEELRNEWKAAIKNNDAGGMLRVFNKLRKK